MRKFIILLVFSILVLFLSYNFVFQNHRDIETEQADFKLTSRTLKGRFLNNAAQSEAKYLNKTIEISGSITEFNKDDITLDNSVFCSFQKAISNPTVILKSRTKVKGRVIGFDDLLEQVKLDQCTIIE